MVAAHGAAYDGEEVGIDFGWGWMGVVMSSLRGMEKSGRLRERLRSAGRDSGSTSRGDLHEGIRIGHDGVVFLRGGYGRFT